MTDLEIILVDDGSTDGSVQKMAQSADYDDHRIRIFSQKNQGAAATRNLGLSHARGQWINFLDADDLLHPEKLQHQLNELEDSPGLMMIGGAWSRFYDTPPKVPQVRADALWQEHSPQSWLATALEHNLMMQPAAWLVSACLTKKAGPWNDALTLNDDGEYFARMMLATDRVGFCAKALSFYRSGITSSLSAGSSPEHFDSAFTAMSLISQNLLAVSSETSVHHALACAWSRLAVESYPNAPEVSERCEENAKQYGEFTPNVGGRWLTRLSRPLGWRAARRLQSTVYALGYRHYGLKRAKKKVIDV